MNENTISRPLIYGAVAVAGLIGLFYAFNTYIYNEKQADTEGEASQPVLVTLEGVVSAVDQSAIAADGPSRITFRTEAGESHIIAVPSMGLPLCAASDTITDPSRIEIGDAVQVRGVRSNDGEIVPCEDVSHYLRVTGFVLDYKVAVGFPYRKGPDGYVHAKDIPGMSTDSSFVTRYQFMLERDKRALEATTDAREGPPTIELRVYENTGNLSPSVWAIRNPLESNSELAFGEPKETVVGGANAITYVADGLYAMHTYVIVHGGFMYVFTASTLDENSPQKRDLDAMLGALSFIPGKG
jgi:hypothetical protein